MKDLAGIFAVIGVFGSLAYAVYAILEAFRVRQQSQLTKEFHQKLLDRVSSVQELGLLLNSERGAKLLASLGSSGGGGAQHRILRAVQTGVVLLSLGIGLFLIGWFNPTLP